MSTGVIGLIGHLVTQHAEKVLEPGNDFASTLTQPREKIVKEIHLIIKPVLQQHLALKVTIFCNCNLS